MSIIENFNLQILAENGVLNYKGSKIDYYFFGPLAHPVEQRTFNPKVARSRLARPTTCSQLVYNSFLNIPESLATIVIRRLLVIRL